MNDLSYNKELVERAATEHGVPPELLYELLALEGTFNFAVRGSRAEFGRAVNRIVEQAANREAGT